MMETRDTAVGGAGRTLVAPVRATLESVTALRSALLEILAAGQSLTLDVRGVEEYDASFLQLLCSACRTVEAGGREFGILAPEEFRQSVSTAGFAVLAARCIPAAAAAGGKETGK